MEYKLKNGGTEVGSFAIIFDVKILLHACAHAVQLGSAQMGGQDGQEAGGQEGQEEEEQWPPSVSSSSPSSTSIVSSSSPLSSTLVTL